MTGGDLVLWEHARWLAAQGHSVLYLAASFPSAPREETYEGVPVVRLGPLHLLWLTTFVYYLRFCRRGFDLVVAEGFGGSRIPRLCPLYVRQPIITEWYQVHDQLFRTQYPGWAVPLLNGLERLTAFIHRKTFVQALTEEWREAFPRLGFHPERIFLCPVSVPDEWLESTPPVAREQRVVWLGKLRRYKCPDHVLQAWPQVVGRHPEARLTIALRRDDRGYEAELRRLARTLGIEDTVEFLVNITDQEKRALLLRSSVMVVPSSVEGFGIVVIEANACGMPVVASSGVPEGAVGEGRNGLRYEFGDIEALANRLSALLSDPPLWSRLSAQSIEFARRFAWHRTAAEFESIATSIVTADHA